MVESTYNDARNLIKRIVDNLITEIKLKRKERGKNDAKTKRRDK